MPEIARPADDAPPEAWLAYADALQAEGDPLGELIVLNHAVANGEDPARRDAYLAQHASALLGPLAPHRERFDIAWRLAVPETVSVNVGPRDDAATLVRALLASPLAPEMRRLRMVGVTPRKYDCVDLSGGVALLPEGLPATCADLELVDERARTSRLLVGVHWDWGENLVSYGPLDAVWAIRHLRSLRLDLADPSFLELGTIDAPALRSFTLLPLRWPFEVERPSAFVRRLAEARWPMLEHLALRMPETVIVNVPSQDGAYITVDRYVQMDDDAADEHWNATDFVTELGPLLRALGRSGLARLSLTGFRTGESLLQALATHGLPPGLEELDLSGSDLFDDDVASMLAHRETFAGLRRLDLRGTAIRDPAPLAALGPRILHEPGVGSVYRFSIGRE